MAPDSENSHCSLLSEEENLKIFKLLGNRCQSLCTTVVQLYLTKPPDHSQWFKKYTGILCFVKDNMKKNFFFRLFCTQKNMKLWEHEMYNNTEYIEATPFFHFFEGENCHVAFNFADINEARDLRIVVNQKIHARKRREDKRSKQISQSQTLPPPTTRLDIMNHRKPTLRRRTINKYEIGTPRDFQHISHIGWDSRHGFDVTTNDEQLKAFFVKAGVSERHLQDKETRDFVYEFIKSHNVEEAIKQTSQLNETMVSPPAVPPRGPPPVSRTTHIRNAPPPPIPNKNSNVNNNATPRKPRMEVPPPKKPAPVPNSGAAPTSPAPPAAPAPAPPPPPPPPPMMSESSNFESTMGVSSSPRPLGMPTIRPVPGGGGNAALMESIKNGTTLKPVEEVKAQQPPQPDARGNLLSEIRQGINLKPVKTNSTPSRSDDLASLLAKTLAKRTLAIHSEDDDDDKSDSGNSDWDD